MAEKIALVIPGFQSSADDWCIPVFTNLAREMAKKVELHIYALRYPHRHDNYKVGDINVHALGGGTLGGVRLPGASLLMLWRQYLSEIEREHRKSPFRAIMGIWATESGWLAVQAARRLHLPSLVHLAGGELTYIPQIKYGNRGRGLSGRLVDSTVHLAKVLTVPSGQMRHALLRKVGANRVVDWSPGVDTEMFFPQFANRSDSAAFTFVTAGSLIPVKGHRLLLRSLAQLRLQWPQFDVRLNIVGDGPLRPMLERLTSDLQLQGYVAFQGDIAHQDLPGIYNRSNAFLLGSWHESQCMAALEAMACGLPWVGPPVGALADLAEPGRQPSGFLYHARDPIQVAAAMKSLIELPPHVRVEMRLAARNVILHNYELRQQTGRLMNLLAELTEG